MSVVDVTDRLDEVERRIVDWDFPGARETVQDLLDEPDLAEADRLTARRLLAEVLRELGELDAAYDLADAVVTQAERRHGPAHEVTVHAVAVLAAVRHDYDEWDEAERLYHRVLDSGIDEDGDTPVCRAVRLARVNLALLQRDRGNRPLALVMLNAAYVVHRREYGADDLDTIRIAAELAALHHEDGNVAAARRLFTLAHAAARARLGNRHPFTRAVEWELAAVEPPMPSAPVSAVPSPSRRRGRLTPLPAPPAPLAPTGSSVPPVPLVSPASPVSPAPLPSPGPGEGRDPDVAQDSSGAPVTDEEWEADGMPQAGEASSRTPSRAVPVPSPPRVTPPVVWPPESADADFAEDFAEDFAGEDLADEDLADDFIDTGYADPAAGQPAFARPAFQQRDFGPPGFAQPVFAQPVLDGSGFGGRAFEGTGPDADPGPRAGDVADDGMRFVFPVKAVVVVVVLALVLAGLSVWRTYDGGGPVGDAPAPLAGASAGASGGTSGGASGPASGGAGSAGGAVPTAAGAPSVQDLRLRDDRTTLTVTWTALRATVVVALSKAGGPAVVLASVPPGTGEYVVRGVEPGVAYCVVVGPVDEQAAISAAVSVCTGVR